jgi:hypothetical protein
MQIFTLLRIILLHFSETRNVGSHGDSRRRRKGVGTTGDDLAAGPAIPDSHTGTLDRVLAAKDTTISGVLRDFDLFHKLTKRRTVTGSVLSDNADLFRAFGHLIILF